MPAPSAIALTPDCDSWLEEEPQRAPLIPVHPAQAPPAPVLVIGSPFLWWMRAGELRALLAPVVAGTRPPRTRRSPPPGASSGAWTPRTARGAGPR